jgi:hypothetical protein
VGILHERWWWGGAIDEKIGGEVEMELERLCIDG